MISTSLPPRGAWIETAFRSDPGLLAMMYDSPILILLGECDRHPEQEQEIMGTLEAHVRLFYQTFHREGGGEHD